MKKWLVVLMVVIFMAASLTGCGSKQPTTTNTPATTDNQTATSGGDDLSKIMKSASGVKEMSYDTITTLTNKEGTMTSTGKVYLSNGKMRMEMQSQGMQMITIVKSQNEVYLYNPTTKTAMKITAPQTNTPNQWAKESGDTTGYKIIGSEMKDGFDCWVVTYTDPANAKNNTKMWLRKDIGMPVRVESATDDGTVVMEYKNFNLGAQDASLFDLPAGTQITAMPSIPNLPQVPQY